MTEPNIVVFTPTMMYGGIDVNWASLNRQTMCKNITWIVADELLDLRAPIYEELASRGAVRNVFTFKLPLRPGYPKNLTSSYKHAMELARDLDADMFVSMQDYFWIQPDGIERFWDACRDHDGDLVASLASVCDNPGPEFVEDPKGLYTIFRYPYLEKPHESFFWKEVRGSHVDGEFDHYVGPVQHWELNVAAVSKKALFCGVDFNIEYDRGIAFDHHEYAWECEKKIGSRVLVDLKFHALGLPHKLYFPEVCEANGKLVWANMELMRKNMGVE